MPYPLNVERRPDHCAVPSLDEICSSTGSLGNRFSELSAAIEHPAPSVVARIIDTSAGIA
jgi:hypothetical protein